MVNLSFYLDNRIVDTMVTRNIVKDNLVEYAVQINDQKIADEIGKFIEFKNENNYFSCKGQAKQTPGGIANRFLMSFKRALAWQESQ